MKSYTLVYLQFFGYSTSDFIPCEICGAKSVDIHHIEARSQRKDLINDINNLMALCRDCHVWAHENKTNKKDLKFIHNEFMKKNGK